MLLSAVSLPALRAGRLLPAQRRPRSEAPTLQLAAASRPDNAGLGLLYQDNKKRTTAQAEFEREQLEPRMTELKPPKRQHGGAPRAKKGKSKGKTKSKAPAAAGFGAAVATTPAQQANALRADTLDTDGVCLVPSVMSSDEALALRETVADELERAYRAVDENPAASVGRFNVPVETFDPLRGYLLLPLRDEKSVVDEVARGPMVEALHELLREDSALGMLFESTCGGPSAELYDHVALRTEPGAARQPLHSDTPYQKVAGLFCAFVALQDCSFSMGATMFVPGTHKNTAERRALIDMTGYADGSREAALRSARSRHTLLKAGDAVVFDMRTLHAGTANFAAEDGGKQRLLLALTFRNRKATEPLGHAPNLRPMYRDRGITLAEMRSELLGDAPFAGIASDGQPFGDGLPVLASE